MKVLIIEDKVERIDFFVGLYSSQEVSIADNVDEARSLLITSDFDVIQLDYDLHELNSYDLMDLIGRNQLVIIHSENNMGVKRLKSRLRNSIDIPYHKFRDKKSGISHLKARLSSRVENLGKVKIWFEELYGR